MNDFKKNITDFHYGKKSTLLSLLFFIPACIYFAIISIKNFLYRINILKEKKAKPYIICIGNLTTGGVGKTPIVIEIANYLQNMGKNVCILSRGYGGKIDNSKPILVKDEKILIDNANLVGDEVNLISKNVKCAVVVCKNRLEGANFAYEKLKSEIVVMDDGFSNRKIKKDLNILLFDTKKLTGNGFCLPLGPLREPLSETKRADKILFIDKNNKKNEKLDNFTSKLKIPYSVCKMENDKIYNIKTGEVLSESKDIIAFSGIGSPEQFYEKLNNFNLKDTISFNDHVEYNQKTIDEIVEQAKKMNAKYILTTEKDMVKLLKFKNIENIYVLKLKPKLNFDEILKEVNYCK